MAEKLLDQFKGYLILEQSCPKCPAKRVKGTTFRRNSCQLHVLGNNPAGRTRVKRADHSRMAQEDIRKRGIRAAIENIIRNRVPAFCFQWKGQRFTSFVLNQTNFPRPPINATQFQPNNVTGPQTALRSQYIALSGGEWC